MRHTRYRIRQIGQKYTDEDKTSWRTALANIDACTRGASADGPIEFIKTAKKNVKIPNLATYDSICGLHSALRDTLTRGLEEHSVFALRFLNLYKRLEGIVL